jgi:hypothetical protein
MTRSAILVLASMTASPLAGQVDLTPGFDPGPAPEMERLSFLMGTWEVQPEFGNPNNPTDRWYPTKPIETTFTPLLNGTFLQSQLAVTWPDGQVWQTISIWSYDRFRKEYRVVFLDDLWGLLDVYEGEFENGNLNVDNGRTETWGPPSNGNPTMARVVLHDIAEDSFILEWEGSANGTEWAPAGLRWRYERVR